MNSGFVISLRWFCLNLDKVTQARVNDFMQIRCGLSKDVERTIINNRKTGKGRLLSNISEVITEYEQARIKILRQVEFLKEMELDNYETDSDLYIEILHECENCITELVTLLIQYYPKIAISRKKQILELYNSGFRSLGKYFAKLESQLPETKTEEGIPNFTNNFDSVKTVEIYKHFKAGLVEKGYLTEQELNEYLKAAFELKTIPETLFKIKDVRKKSTIEAVFYTYYKNVAGKIHGKQSQYAALLGDYFEGYKTTTVSTNFSKSVY